MFTLKFATDNAAFDDNHTNEIARILRKLADRIETGAADGDLGENIYDYNGNRIGICTFDAPEADNA